MLQAQEDLGGAWRSLLSDPVERAAAGMREALPAVAEEYGALAGDAAAIWYEDVRPSKLPRYQPRTFVPQVLQDAEGLATWGVTPLFEGDIDAAWERLSGTLQQIVAGHDRETVQGNAGRDPGVVRWRREAKAGACAYCAYMSVLSEIYVSAEEWAKWDDPAKYHDDCGCEPVVEFVGEPLGPLPNGDVWGDVFEKAHEAVSEDYARKRKLAPNLRRTTFYRRFPETTLTTKNILREARRIGGPGMFGDGTLPKSA